ncbi:MAG: hypothetical protein K2X94_03575 [Amoebophilaceae bacterium]|nr:hypothetical protein [Amoebophilaceae bacterium]
MENEEINPIPVEIQKFLREIKNDINVTFEAAAHKKTELIDEVFAKVEYDPNYFETRKGHFEFFDFIARKKAINLVVRERTVSLTQAFIGLGFSKDEISYFYNKQMRKYGEQYGFSYAE